LTRKKTAASGKRSVWLTGDLDIDRIMGVLIPFGDGPIIVKDFVKSRKHEWTDACFIPSAADRSAVERVVNRFLELQGEELAGGLVFREFIEFRPVGTHSRSRMPLTEEWDPDHDPSGAPVERRAIQLGLRGEALTMYVREWLLGIEDVSEFVREQREYARSPFDKLITAREDVYPVTDPVVAAAKRGWSRREEVATTQVGRRFSVRL
jgi:hypothetical protein